MHVQSRILGQRPTHRNEPPPVDPKLMAALGQRFDIAGTPFHISRNELAVADVRRNDWHLVRLYDFASQPKAFAFRPHLEAHVELTATSFLAGLR